MYQNLNQNSVHIGHAIEEKLQELKLSKTQFGRRIGIPQQNVNRILEKESIDTAKLVLISNALNFNFFTLFCSNSIATSVHTEGDYSPASRDGNVSVVVGDSVLAERVKSLEALLAEKERLIKVLMER